MATITWRNLNAPDLTGAANLMQGAAQSFDTAINRFSGVMDNRLDAKAQVVNEQRKANETDFRDYLQSFVKPEDLQAAKDSGALDKKLAAYGGVIDQNAIRGLADERVNSLRDSATKQFEYDRQVEEQKDAPVVEAFGAKLQDTLRRVTDEKQLPAVMDGLANELTQARDEGRLSTRGYQTMMEQVYTLGDKQEGEVRDDANNAYTVGRRGILDARGDKTYNRQEEAIAREDYRNTAAQNLLASPDTAGMSDTEKLARLRTHLLEQKQPVDEVDAFIASFENSLAARTKVAAGDQNRALAAQSAIDTKYDAVSNPFIIKKDVNPTEEAAKIVADNAGDGKPLSTGGADFRLETTAEISKLMSTGMTVQVNDKDAKGGVRVVNLDKVPPEIIRMALQGVEDTWFRNDQTVEEAVQKLFQEDASLAKRYDDFLAHTVESTDLATKVSQLARDEFSKKLRESTK